MISYAAYCSTQAMHNCAHEVAKYLMVFRYSGIYRWQGIGAK